MLPSTGNFKDDICPFYESGLCERPYCHFKHSRRERDSSANAPNDGIESGAILQRLVSAAVQKVLLQQTEASTTTTTVQLPTPEEGNVTNNVNNTQPRATYNPTPIAELNKIISAEVENSIEDLTEQRKRHIPVPYTPRKPASLPVKRPIENNGASKPFVFVPPPVKYTPGCTESVQLDPYTPKGAVDSGEKYLPGTETELQTYTPKETQTQTTKHNYVPSDRSTSKKKVLEYKPTKVNKKTEISSVTYQPTPKSLVPCFSSDEDEPDSKKQKLTNDLNGLDDLGPEFDILDQILDEENRNCDNGSNSVIDDSKSIETNEEHTALEKYKDNIKKHKKSSHKHDEKRSTHKSNIKNSEEKARTEKDKRDKSEHSKNNLKSSESKYDSKTSEQIKRRNKSNDSKTSEHSKSDSKSSEHSKGDRKSSEHSKGDRKSSEHSKGDGKNYSKSSEHSKTDSKSLEHNKSDIKSSEHSKSDSKSSEYSKIDSKHSDHSKSDVKSRETEKKSHKSSSSKEKNREKNRDKSTEKDKHSIKSSDKSSKHSSSKSSDRHSKHSRGSSSKQDSKTKEKSEHHHKSSKESSKDKNKKSRDKDKQSTNNNLAENNSHINSEDTTFHNNDDDEMLEMSESDEESIALQCKRIFEEYVPTEKKYTNVDDTNSHLIESNNDTEYIPSKKRISRTTDKNIKVIPKTPLKPDYKVSAAQTMAERLAKIKEFHGSRDAQIPKNETTATKQEPVKPPPPLSAPHNTNAKIRIAHVPYASNMMTAKKTIAPITKTKSAEPSTSSTTIQTVKKGSQRVAHIPNEKFIDRPGVLEPLASKIAANVRSTYLNMMIDECLKIYLSATDAYARAQHEELMTSKKCSTVQIYKNSAVLTVSRLRKEFQECNGIKKSGSDCTALQRIPQTISGNTSNVGSWSIESKRTVNISQEFIGAKFYKNIQKWILTEEQLQENGFPRPHASGEKGRAIIYGQNKKTPPKGLIRTCCRCKKDYIVDKKGFPAISEECIYHPNNKYRVRGEAKYQCCSQDSSSDGCCVAPCHVYEYVDFENLKGFIKTMPPDYEMDDYGVYSLDCEMCYTTQGLDLTRVTVINSACKVVYETLIKPLHPIIDYNTRYSGITEEQMVNVKTTLLEVQATLLSMFNSKTILVGHSLESDFKALKLIHDTVIDTSVLFPHKMGPPFKRALRNLSSEYLKKIIQNSVEGHDSAEDATVCMELLIYKLKEDLKTR